MARLRGAKKRHEAAGSLTSKLLAPQAASAEPSRGSRQYRATHRNCNEGPELSSRWLSLRYRKGPRLVLLHLWHDYRHRLRLRRQSSPHLISQQENWITYTVPASRLLPGAASPSLLLLATRYIDFTNTRSDGIVTRLDRPCRPVGELFMDLFPRAVIIDPHLGYSRILFCCPLHASASS